MWLFVTLNVRLQTSTGSGRDDSGIQPVFVITVDDPQKVGDPIRSFTMYTVHTRVRANILSLLSFILTVVFTDNFTVISEILFLGTPTLLGFPMAI